MGNDIPKRIVTLGEYLTENRQITNTLTEFIFGLIVNQFVKKRDDASSLLDFNLPFIQCNKLKMMDYDIAYKMACSYYGYNVKDDMTVKCWVLGPLIDINGIQKYELMQITMKRVSWETYDKHWEKKAVVHGKHQLWMSVLFVPNRVETFKAKYVVKI